MQIIVQIVLVLAVIVVSLALMRGGSNARHLAIRRILVVLFTALAALSVFIPSILTKAWEEVAGQTESSRSDV